MKYSKRSYQLFAIMDDKDLNMPQLGLDPGGGIASKRRKPLSLMPVYRYRSVFLITSPLYPEEALYHESEQSQPEWPSVRQRAP